MTGVLFIVGAGPRIGFAVALAFKERGFKVAIGSRNPDTEQARDAGLTAVQVDVTDSSLVSRAFEDVRSKLGIPNVVVYNAAALTMSPSGNPFALSNEDFLKDLHVNLVGAYATLRETVQGFHSVGPSSAEPRVFIATGNVVPFQPHPAAITLGSGKAALAHLIEVGLQAYGEKGYRFYFASQVTKDEGPVPYPEVDANAHGRQYLALVDSKEQGPWNVRFKA